MALPDGLPGVVVTIGRFMNQAGATSYSGSVTFTPSSERTYIPGAFLMTADPIVVQLQDGSAQTTLVASDAPDCTATNVQYTVTYQLRNPDGKAVQRAPITLTLPAATPYVDLDIASSATVVQPTYPTWLSVVSWAGLTGIITAEQAAAAVQPFLPSGGGGTPMPVGGWGVDYLDSFVNSMLAHGNDAYLKPTGGIPETDMADPVRQALVAARTALQGPLSTAAIQSGVFPAARLGTGATGGTIRFLREDGTYQIPPAGGGSGTVPSALKTTAYTLISADAGTAVEFNSSTPVNLTIPAGMPDDMVVEVLQLGAGQVTLVPASGVTLRTPSTLTTRARYSTLGLRKRPSAGVTATLPTTNLGLRFKGDDVSGVQGAAVASWPESSGNGHPAATATGTNQPTVQQAILNGHKGVAFSGGSQRLLLSGTALDAFRNRAGVTVFVLARYESALTGTRSLLSFSVGGSPGTNSRFFLQKNSSDAYQVGGRRLDADSSSVNINSGSTDIVLNDWELWEARISYSGNLADLLINGVSMASSTTFMTGSTANTSNTSSLTGAIGSNSAGTSEMFPGTMVEILVYTTDIGTSNRDQVRTYFANAYDLSIPGTSVPDEWIVSGDLT